MRFNFLISSSLVFLPVLLFFPFKLLLFWPLTPLFISHLLTSLQSQEMLQLHFLSCLGRIVLTSFDYPNIVYSTFPSADRTQGDHLKRYKTNKYQSHFNLLPSLLSRFFTSSQQKTKLYSPHPFIAVFSFFNTGCCLLFMPPHHLPHALHPLFIYTHPPSLISKHPESGWEGSAGRKDSLRLP